MNNRIKVGMLLVCAMSIAQINADDTSWFSGWGTALKNAGTGLYNSIAQTSFYKKNKEKIAAGTAVVAGTGLASWAGWYYWFKKPSIKQKAMREEAARKKAIEFAGETKLLVNAPDRFVTRKQPRHEELVEIETKKLWNEIERQVGKAPKLMYADYKGNVNAHDMSPLSSNHWSAIMDRNNGFANDNKIKQYFRSIHNNEKAKNILKKIYDINRVDNKQLINE